MLLGCASAPAPQTSQATTTSPPQRASGFGETLAELAREALEQGELEVAENRYQRLLSRDPRSVDARMGLARVALARGRRDRAREHFDAVLAIDPAHAEAHIGLADLAEDPARARSLLERALLASPAHPGVLARLADHTGRAPRAADSLEDALALAEAHPFDPRVLLDAGRRLALAGRRDQAIEHLEGTVALGDLDAEALEAAVRTLREVAPGWSGRRLVAVRVFVDAALREPPGWRFRQRRLWLELSASLDPLLGARFVPVSFSPFDAAPPGASLDARLRGLVYQTGSSDEQAIFAGFTAEEAPRLSGAKRGVAIYLGRHLFVRDAPGAEVARVLAHELLHVYGGIHVADDLESLMNPSGQSSQVDPLNAAIVRAMAARTFGAGGQEPNVVARVEIDEATEAFTRALQVNLAFRRAGLGELLGDAKMVGPGAFARAQQVIGLDTHLGDVSQFVARLYWASERRVQSVVMLELASQLYGRQSPQGRAARTQADVLRRRLRFELGVD